MIRQRDFSSLRPLIFAICVVYLLLTIGTLALSFTLNKATRVHGGNFQCELPGSGRPMVCGKIRSSTLIQVLVWIECLLLLPIIVLCMLTLWARATVERLPGNMPYAIPLSLLVMFILQIIFLITFFARGYFHHHWMMDLALFLQSLFALPVAYLFFNLPQINGESDPPFLRDDRQNLLKTAASRDKNGVASSPSSKRSAPAAKPPQPTTTSTATDLQAGSGTGTGTGSREEEERGSITGSKEPLQFAETIPVAPPSDPAFTATEGRTVKSQKNEDKSGKPPVETGPPARELEDSESKKNAKQHSKSDELHKSKSMKSATSDRLKHTTIVIPPKSKTRSARSFIDFLDSVVDSERSPIDNSNNRIKRSPPSDSLSLYPKDDLIPIEVERFRRGKKDPKKISKQAKKKQPSVEEAVIDENVDKTQEDDDEIETTTEKGWLLRQGEKISKGYKNAKESVKEFVKDPLGCRTLSAVRFYEKPRVSFFAVPELRGNVRFLRERTAKGKMKKLFKGNKDKPKKE